MYRIAWIAYSDSFGGACQAAYRNFKKVKARSSFKHNYYCRHQGLSDSGASIVIGLRFLNSVRFQFSNIFHRLFKPKNFKSLNVLPSISFFHILKRADILNLQWVGCETIGLLQIGLCKKPVVWTLHDIWPFFGAVHVWENNKAKRGFVNRLLLRRVIENENIYFVVPSHSMRRKVASLGAEVSDLKFSDRIRVIPNPIDLTFWAKGDWGTVKRKSRRVLLVSYGAYEDQNKGVLAFLELAGEVLDCNTEIFVVGANKTRKHHIGNLVVHDIKTCDREKLRQLYETCDVLAHPSRFESYGQVVAEAQLCGLPVVCFEGNGPDDFVVQGATGQLVKQGRMDLLVNSVDQVLQGQYDRNQIKDYALANLRDDVSDEYDKLFSECLLN